MSSPATKIDELSVDKQEWLESIDYIYDEFGEQGVQEILSALENHVSGRGVTLNEATLNTPYVNTIPLSEQPRYPRECRPGKAY